GPPRRLHRPRRARRPRRPARPPARLDHQGVGRADGQQRLRPGGPVHRRDPAHRRGQRDRATARHRRHGRRPQQAAPRGDHPQALGPHPVAGGGRLGRRAAHLRRGRRRPRAAGHPRRHRRRRRRGGLRRRRPRGHPPRRAHPGLDRAALPRSGGRRSPLHGRLAVPRGSRQDRHPRGPRVADERPRAQGLQPPRRRLLGLSRPRRRHDARQRAPAPLGVARAGLV
ncbi:MAG: MBL-fold metallo-hydrolase superfamily, partial [uncultured Actinomycetospora sp.]